MAYLPEAFERAVHLRPRWAEALGNLAWAYAMLGRFNEGIRTCQEALQRKPDHALHHNNLCLMFIASGNRAGAFREYETVKRLDPQMARRLTEAIEIA